MFDPDVFAVLKPADARNKASSAFRLAHNARWFSPAVDGVAAEPTVGSREVTPAFDLSAEECNSSKPEHLTLKFSELMKTGFGASHNLPGILFGTDNQTCDILLGFRGTKGISAKQYCMTIDDEFRIWATDTGSTHGTIVETDGQNKDEVRKKATWLIARAPEDNPFDSVILWSGALGVDVSFPNHPSGRSIYLENLKNLHNYYCNKSKAQQNDSTSIAFSILGIDSHTTTAAPSMPVTPTERPVYLRETRIGHGAFGEVYKVLRMNDGQHCAAKLFNAVKASKKRRYNSLEPEWLQTIRQEFEILSKNPHVRSIFLISVLS